MAFQIEKVKIRTLCQNRKGTRHPRVVIYGVATRPPTASSRGLDKRVKRILTEAAYHASRYALVPVKPEFLATIGLPLLARSIQEFKYDNGDHALDICGIVFNHSSSYSEGPEGARSIKEVQTEAKKNAWPVFEASGQSC